MGGPEVGPRVTGPPTGDRRLFIAVAVPAAVRAALADVLAAARASASGGSSVGVRWVAADGLHLTLRFLGATPPSRVEAAADAVREASASARSFQVSLGGCGAFPREEAPRALWLGVDAGGADLEALARAVEASLVARGWPVEPRPFRAHLTLARSEESAAGRAALAALRAALAAAGPEPPRLWRARELVLYESHLGRGPARYAALTTAAFAG